MADAQAAPHAGEPHPWASLTPDQVLTTLVYELYGPVSALGSEIDRIASGTFEDDELEGLLSQMRDAVNQLSRLVVTLKRYTGEHKSAASSSADASEPTSDAAPNDPAADAASPAQEPPATE